MAENGTPTGAKVSVLGGGAFGTALALHCGRKGHDVLIWALEKDVVDAINNEHENTTYFPGWKLPENVRASTDIKEVAGFGELVLMVIPVPFIASTVEKCKDSLKESQILCSCSKGIMVQTLETPDTILKRVLPENMRARSAFMSGPSFAAEVAAGKPTAVTIASENEEVATKAQEMLSAPLFRCYRTNDIVGVELGGALKNVLAIGCGISDGLDFGANARAALITRGLAELITLASKCGANPLTLSGLSGVGDLVLTCTGDLSRNRTVGLRIGKGETLEEITKSMKAVAEGVLTAKAAHHLAQAKGVDCPVLSGLYRVIHEGADPKQVVLENMSRPLKQEVNQLVIDAAHHI